MLTVADHKIPYLEETFGQFTRVQKYPSTELVRETVEPADALLVRSETVVDANLLTGSRVRFVGSPTIGVDHIDLSFLRQSGITFANAPGCNARSVVEYVLTALTCLALRRGKSLAGGKLGIVGVGNIGSRLAEAAKLLGLKVLLNDPPRQAREPDLNFLELEDLLAADFMTLHVPLVTAAPFPTLHLVDTSLLSRLRPECVLINTSRGSVVDNRALRKALREGRLGGAVLDVWEAEPHPDPDLIRCVDLATPHIAGYSLDGKLRGAWAVFEAFCRAFQLDARFLKSPLLPAPDPAVLTLERSDSNPWLAGYRLLQEAYPILRDDVALRRTAFLERREERGREFRALRANYPLRREFSAFQYRGDAGRDLKQNLEGLGFRPVS